MQDEGARRAGPTRRQLLASGGASALALTAGLGSAQRPTMARGVVFDDRGGTGRRRHGDPGIPGVMVSNGRDVVLTDAEGRWRLPADNGDSLFVVKPPQWTTPIAANGLPQFSYLHHPQGTPGGIEYRYAGVSPTGPLPDSIDFPLRRQAESPRFEALLVADTQPENDTELGYLRDDILAAVPGTGAAFAINHGDVMFEDLSLLPRYLDVLGATGIPWHHIPGNHDMNAESPDDRHSRETWKRVFGARHYAFQHAGATFVLLDNVHYYGHNPGAPRSGEYCGLIGERQLGFVRNVLAHVPREQLVVLSLHIPLVTYVEPPNASDSTADRLALLELLADRPHAVSFSGHMHTTEHHYLSGGRHGGPPAHHHHVLATASGGWWGGPRDRRGIPFADCPDGCPNGYHVLAVDGARYETRFVAGLGKREGRLRAILCGPHGTSAQPPSSAPIRSSELAACELVVNVFDGGPRTSVVYEVAGGRSQPFPMQRIAAPDPFIIDLCAREAAMQKSWFEIVASSHLWRAPICADLGPGAHRITVRATDEYGHVLTTHLVVEVAAPGRLG